MATPASIRIPWRAITRSTIAHPSSHLFRAQCSAPAATTQVFGRRYASDISTPLPSTSIPEPEQPIPTSSTSPDDSDLPHLLDTRLPRAVQAVYLRPLRRTPIFGVPVCDLQLRAYNIRNLEFFCDFALRAAYYLDLPASGPVPLPRITERWTVPRASFVYKKSQENFERRTVRRLIQIQDGHGDNVRLWLAFLRKHSYYGIGMKANVFEFAKLGVGKEMDAEMEKMKSQLDGTWDRFAWKRGSETEEKAMEIINREDFRAATGKTAPMMRPHLKRLV